MMKATSYMKSRKFLGIPGFFSRLKEKGTLAKDAWGVIGSALNVQASIEVFMIPQSLPCSVCLIILLLPIANGQTAGERRDTGRSAARAGNRCYREDSVGFLARHSVRSRECFARGKKDLACWTVCIIDTTVQVCDLVLKEHGLSEQILINRAKVHSSFPARI